MTAALQRAMQTLRCLGRNDGILLIPLAALLVSSPRFVQGVSCGHDFGFHLVSWFEVQRSWSQGILYPHWAGSPNWGAGEARFVFYPPLTWALGALLGYLFPWDWVPAAFVFLCLAAIGLTTRSFARQFLTPAAATLAAVLATATPYLLFTTWERTAFGELAASAFLPLLLLFALRPPDSVQEKRLAFAPIRDGSAVRLAPVLALIWLTNAPAGVMASYLLAFAALSASLLLRTWWPVVRAGIAAPLGLGLAAFYLVPAAWEQRWVAIQQAVDVGMRVSDSWLFARHASPDLADHDQVLRAASIVVALTAVLAALGFGVCLWRSKLPRTARHFWMPLAILIPGIVILQLPISAALWNLLPRLRFLQFPWRWLMVLDLPFAIFLAAATPLASRLNRRLAFATWALVLVTFVAVGAHFFFQFCDGEDNVANQSAVFASGAGVEGSDEYAALGSDNSQLASGLPDACLVTDAAQQLGEGDTDATPVWYPEQGSCDDVYTAQLWQNEHKLLHIEPDHAGLVILRLRSYPAWQITLNGRPAPQAMPPRADGLVAIAVPAGPSTIEIRWITTPDRLWGRGISLAALIVLVLLVVLAIWPRFSNPAASPVPRAARLS